MEIVTRGNDFYLKCNLYKRLSDGTQVPFDLTVADSFKGIIYQELGSNKPLCTDIGIGEETNTLLIDVTNLPTAKRYVVEVSGELNGRKFRCAEIGILSICEYNKDANITWETIDGSVGSELNMTFEIVSSAAVVGKNAYELAKENGYEGTLQDYLNDMVDNGNSAKAAIEAANTANNAANTALEAADTVIDAAEKVNEAIALANEASSIAGTAASKATAAANTADEAVQTVNQAVSTLDGKITAAEQATTNANTAATNANTEAGKATTATNKANTATQNANNAASAANTAAGNANTATTAANNAASSANSAAQSATTATQTVNTTLSNFEDTTDALIADLEAYKTQLGDIKLSVVEELPVETDNNTLYIIVEDVTE